MSQFNLFSCHKYLEQSGARLLASLAKCDGHKRKTLDEIQQSLVEFSERLKGHAQWEEHFVFKLLPLEAVSDEKDFHKHLDTEIDAIQEQLLSLGVSPNKDLHGIYLRFRKFYAGLLSHLHEEEVTIMKMLSDKYPEKELRRIDYDIYKDMSAQDIVAMLGELLPPCNWPEKLALLEDLQAANPRALRDAWLDMKALFSEEEIKKAEVLLHN